MDEVRPHNTSERTYALVANVFGFMMAIAVVSRLTSAMTQLYILDSHLSKQFSTLRSYLAKRCVTRRLALRIQRNAQDTIRQNQRDAPEHSVELLRLVSEPLRAELHF